MQKEFIDRLNQGEQVIGMFAGLGSVTAVECIGLGGMDFVVVDTEHGPGDVESTLPAVIAAERRGLAPIVRVKDPSRPSVLKMLDIGAAGVIVPFIQHIEEVQRLVEYAKFAPRGMRGYGITRANDYGSPEFADVDAYFEDSNQHTLLLPQCETAGCLQDIEAIAETDGVDGIFVGPYDLSVALKIPGQMEADALHSAINRILRACKNADKHAFIFAGTTAAAKRYMAMGYDAVTIGVDASVLADAVRGIVKTVKE